MLGFPVGSLRVIASDERYRIRLDDLERCLLEDRRSGRRPLLLNANAGTTNTGAIDPLPELAEIAAEHELWLHADAAYGGFAVLCDEGRALLRGLEQADSVTLDPHKWLYAPMGTGCFLTRRRGVLEQAFSVGGDYLQDVPRTEVNYFERGIELSRPARALPVWFLMRTVGLERLAQEIAEDLRLARLAEAWLQEDPGFELAAPTVLSVVSFRHRREAAETEEARSARDHELMRRTLRAGEVMVSTTELRGRTALRLVVLNHRTDEAELRRSIDAIRHQRVEAC